MKKTILETDIRNKVYGIWYMVFLYFLIPLYLIPYTSFAQSSSPRQSTQCTAVTFIKNSKQSPSYAVQSRMRKQDPWKNFYSKNSSWQVEFNEITGLPHRAFGKAIPSRGRTTTEKALNFLHDNFPGFSLPIRNLALQSETANSKYTYVDFYQTYRGIRILNSHVTFRITPSGSVAMFGLDVFKNIQPDMNPKIDPEKIKTFAVQGLPENAVKIIVSPELQLLPVEKKGKYNFRLVYEVTVKSTGKLHGNFYTLVDAITGEVLYRQNRVASVINVTVQGTVTDNGYDSTSYTTGLPYVMGDINGNFLYADSAGLITTTDNTTVAASFSLEGEYVRVFRGATAGTPPSFSVNLPPGNDTVNFDNTAYSPEISVYYNVNRIHDHMKKLTPAGFTNLDYPMEARVDDISQSCNAEYIGSSLIFYTENDSCIALSLFNDVVFHEYGHAIDNELYTYFGGTFGNKALGEGYADVWAMSLTKNPVLSQGYARTPGSFLRRYDKNPKVYPGDLQGEPYNDGEIIAGAWWDLGQNLDSIEQMMEIFIGTLYAKLTKPDGQEGILYRDVLYETLIFDDDDANISNGTPNGIAICNAFGRHGISLVSNAEFTHTPVDSSQANSPIPVTATLEIPSITYLGGVALRYRVNGSSVWTDIPLVNTGGINYAGQIPPQPEGTFITYYIGVYDNICGFLSNVFPPGAADINDPNLPYYILVGYKLMAADDFGDNSTIGNWTLGLPGDNATTGIWTINEPVGTLDNSANPPVQVQPEDQHTPGGFLCAVTGNGSSVNAFDDVDDGVTTLESPALNLTTYNDPLISYYRWFKNDCPQSANPGNDRWVVRISNDKTIWKNVENTFTSDNSWRRVVIRAADYVTPTANVQLRFYASDSIKTGAGLQYEGGSIVEAAVDDLAIWDKLSSDIQIQTVNPTCAGVCNGSAIATPQTNTPPYSYLWNDPDSQTTATATGLCAGSYQVTITDSTGLVYSTNLAIVNPAALSGSVTVKNAGCDTCSSGQLTANAAGGSGIYSYQWSDPDSQTTAIATGLNKGTYSVTITDVSCSQSVVVTAVIGITGLPKILPVGDVQIFPNPSEGIFDLRFYDFPPKADPLYAEIFKNTQIKIYNVLGEIVYQKSLLKDAFHKLNQTGIYRIDMRNQPGGIYYLLLNLDGKLINKKIIKK